MKKLKSEKGAITIIVLVSVLFFVSFLISSYVIIANKVQTQKEIIAETKKIYEPKSSMEDIYNSYFNNDEIIPIYTVEQLLAIGEEENQINIDGKYYTFTNTSSYILKNDLEFSAIDLGLTEDWIPLGSNNSNFKGNLEGNGYTITVTNLDGIEHIYSTENNYGGECLLTFNITPEDASITVTINEEIQDEIPKSVPYNTKLTYIAKKDGLEQQETIIIRKNTVIEIQLQLFPNNWTIAEEKQEDWSENVTAITDGINVIPLPKNYKVSSQEGENTIDEGVVITDGENEFVWIPVTDKYNSVSPYKYEGESGYAEPVELLFDTQAMINNYYGIGFYTYPSTSEEKTNINNNLAYLGHYAEMVQSVNTYSGFYIGRYETTLESDNIIGSKENTEVLVIDKTLDTGNQYLWWGLYVSQRESNVLGNGEYVQTNMIWGQQWDSMIKYFGTIGKEYSSEEVQTLSTSHNLQKSAQTIYIYSENYINDEIYNIFDLRGNAYDWTAESYGNYARAARGGDYNATNAANIRTYITPSETYYCNGSRLTMYIK